MTGEPYAGADPGSDVVYVMWGDKGLGVRITPDLQVYEWFANPGIDMIPLLVDSDDYAEQVDEALNEQRTEVLAALEHVRLGKRVREALASALDRDADDIGRPAR